MSCLPDQLFEAPDCLFQGNEFTFQTGEPLRNVERLGEEALNLAGPGDGQLIFLRKLIDSEDRDDVLEVLVALKHTLDFLRDVVVLLSDNSGVEIPRG